VINSITSGISSIASQLDSLSTAKGGDAKSGFGDVFKAAVQQVDALQTGADQKIGSLLQGGPNTDVGNVMVSVEKADVAFQLMMQVRNKIVNAYQDIEKMQF
jgi:flagellar hook-basal body complex protein FliE